MTDWSVLGTLSAVPALDRPDLLGDPVAHALKLLDPADAALVGVAEIDPTLADTAAFCEAYGSPMDGSANCVIVAGRRGETTRYADPVAGSSISWAGPVDRYNEIDTDKIVTIFGARGYIW